MIHDTSSEGSGNNVGWRWRKKDKAPRLTFYLFIILAAVFVLRNLSIMVPTPSSKNEGLDSPSQWRYTVHATKSKLNGIDEPQLDSYPKIGAMPDPRGTISKSIRDSWGGNCGDHCVSGAQCAPVTEKLHTYLRRTLKEWLQITAYLNITTINSGGSLIASLFRNTTLMRLDAGGIDMLIWAHDMAPLEKFATLYNTEARKFGFELVVQPDWRHKYMRDSPTNGGRKEYPDRGVNFLSPCARLYARSGMVEVFCMYADNYDAEDGGLIVGADNFTNVKILDNRFNWRSIPREWMFPVQPCFLDGILMDCPAKGSQVLREIYGTSTNISIPDHFLDRRTGCWEKGTKKAFEEFGGMNRSTSICNPIAPYSKCTTHEINLGPFSTPHECAQATASHLKCGDTFMFSESYPSWGCRCCAAADYRIEDSGNDTWELYSASTCAVKQTRAVLEKKIAYLDRVVAYLEEKNRALEDVASYKSTPEVTVSEIYGDLREVVETLRKEGSKLNTTWFAMGGTLIGALRSHPPGMTRWDDDVDLAVKTSDLEDLHNVLKSNPRLSWTRHPFFFAYKYRLKNGEYFRLDVFGLGKVGSKWHILKASGEPDDIDEYFTDEEIQSTYPCQFWDLTLECPVGGHSYLQRTFGKSVMREAKVWNHVDGSFRDINMVGQNLNQHSAYFPAMTRELMSKLQFAPDREESM